MMTDVIIIRHKGETCAKLSGWLKEQGCEVWKQDDEIGLVEASVPVELIPRLEKLPCVSYVRKVFNYATSEPIVIHPDDHL